MRNTFERVAGALLQPSEEHSDPACAGPHYSTAAAEAAAAAAPPLAEIHRMRGGFVQPLGAANASGGAALEVQAGPERAAAGQAGGRAAGGAGSQGGMVAASGGGVSRSEGSTAAAGSAEECGATREAEEEGEGEEEDEDDDGGEGFVSDWAASLPGGGWLRVNPVGVPTEREVATLAAGGGIFRMLLERRDDKEEGERNNGVAIPLLLRQQ